MKRIHLFGALISVLVVVALLLASLPAMVLAESTPMQTWGDVILDGAAAPVGTTIEIFIGADTTPSGFGNVTTAGQYGTIVLWGDSSRYGEPLTYKVNGFASTKLGPDPGVFGLANQVVNLESEITPMLCWGVVTLDGAAAPEGTIVDIYIGDDATPRATTMVDTHGGVDPPGTYGAVPIREDVSRYYEPLTYKVNGIIAATDKVMRPCNNFSTPIFWLCNQEVNLEAISGTLPVTLTVQVDGCGITSPVVGLHVYEAGSIVDLNASPCEFWWVFDSWTGDVANPLSASTTVTMDTDKIVTAHFKEIIVPIDIRPNSDPNLLYLNSKGMLPVAILGTEGFDAMTVDPDTVKLQGIKADSYRIKDVDHDGYKDMLVYFENEDVVATLGTVEIGDEIILLLIGELSDDTPIAGEDTVVIAQKGKGKKK